MHVTPHTSVLCGDGKKHTHREIEHTRTDTQTLAQNTDKKTDGHTSSDRQTHTQTQTEKGFDYNANCSVHDLSLVKTHTHARTTCQHTQTRKGEGEKNTYILPLRLYCGAHFCVNTAGTQARVSWLRVKRPTSARKGLANDKTTHARHTHTHTHTRARARVHTHTHTHTHKTTTLFSKARQSTLPSIFHSTRTRNGGRAQDSPRSERGVPRLRGSSHAPPPRSSGQARADRPWPAAAAQPWTAGVTSGETLRVARASSAGAPGVPGLSGVAAGSSSTAPRGPAAGGGGCAQRCRQTGECWPSPACCVLSCVCSSGLPRGRS